MTQPILVVGGTGRTGRYVVQKLLERGHSVRVLTRDEQHARQLFQGEIEYVRGNVGVPETLVDAVRGARAIITAAYGGNRERPEIVDYQGTRNLLELARVEDVQPFIFTSTIYVTRTDHYLNTDGQILTWKGRAEALIRASDIPYSIVRAGWLTNEPWTQGIRAEQGDTTEGSISREAVAEVLVNAFEQKSALGKTFEIVEGPDESPQDWHTFFAALSEDKT